MVNAACGRAEHWRGCFLIKGVLTGFFVTRKEEKKPPEKKS
jgi:hypothetical protein